MILDVSFKVIFFKNIIIIIYLNLTVKRLNVLSYQLRFIDFSTVFKDQKELRSMSLLIENRNFNPFTEGYRRNKTLPVDCIW